MPDGLWTEVHDIAQETRIKTIPMEKKCKRAKWLSKEALQIAEERREAKSKGEKERYTLLNAEFQRIAREARRPSSVNNAKKQENYRKCTLSWQNPNSLCPASFRSSRPNLPVTPGVP